MTQNSQPCCGSGVCIVNQNGECWCGQVWDGTKFVAPALLQPKSSDSNEPVLKSPDPIK
jgi:hypothetical protein